MFRLRGWPLLADESEALTRTVPLYERFIPTDYLLRQIDRYASLNIFEERRETDQIYRNEYRIVSWFTTASMRVFQSILSL